MLNTPASLSLELPTFHRGSRRPLQVRNPLICIRPGEWKLVPTPRPLLSAASRVKTLKVDPAETPTPPPCGTSAARLIVVLPFLVPQRLLVTRALICPVPGSTIASAATRGRDGVVEA